MQKTILSILLLLLSICPEFILAQDGEALSKKLIVLGHHYRIGGTEEPNYEKAYSCFSRAAALGNPEGLNCMAIMHQKGIGMEKDTRTAFCLFDKAGKAGSGKALYNLGLIYKFGEDVGINYETAYNYFLQSALTGYEGGMYGVGYFLFKGLGVTQNYEEAVKWFQQGAEQGRASCKYMLGYAYRNGYGVEKDMQKAKKWLEAAALDGYQLALDELLISDEENKGKSNLKSASLAETSSNIPQVYKKIHGVSNDIILTGNWTGKLATYDFSGNFLITEKNINLTIEQNGNDIWGHWQFNDSLQIELTGYLTDSLIYFTSGNYNEPDRYGVTLDWDFKGGTLESYQQDNKQILAGNVFMYSPYIKEPGRPSILLLSKTLIIHDSIQNPNDEAPVPVDSINTNIEVIATNSPKEIKENQLIKKLLSVPQFEVYPNPVVDELTISGYLPKEDKVQIELYTLSGKRVLNICNKVLPTGNFRETIRPEIAPGNYLIFIQSNGKSKSMLIVKK